MKYRLKLRAQKKTLQGLHASLQATAAVELVRSFGQSSGAGGIVMCRSQSFVRFNLGIIHLEINLQNISTGAGSRITWPEEARNKQRGFIRLHRTSATTACWRISPSSFTRRR